MTISEGAARAAVYDEARANVDHPLHGYVWAEAIVSEMADLADRLAAPEGIDWNEQYQDYQRINGYFAKIRYFLMIQIEKEASNASNA